jgi:2-iminobutanoate/2-iminopropanoate deaminase
LRFRLNRFLKNIEAVIKAAGSDLDHVVKTTVFLKDMNDFSKMNQVYEMVFKHNPPARSAVEVSRLPRDVLIEMECIAEIIA